jgi:hypothetical protein
LRLIGALGHRGPELVRSAVGDIGAAAAGKASPASRRATSRATVSPPPAESPATAIDRALRAWSVGASAMRPGRRRWRPGRDARGPGDIQGTHPHSAGPSQPGGQLAVAAKRAELVTSAAQEDGAPSRCPFPGRQASGPAPPPAVTSFTRTSSAPDEGGPRAKEVRRSSSVGGPGRHWPAAGP